MSERGQNYELNMSFNSLQDRHWRHLLNTLWQQEQISGPFASRFHNSGSPPRLVDIQYPDPTATFTQYGKLNVGSESLPIKVLVTRSLFECISITIAQSDLDQTDTLTELQEILKNIALHLYQASPFQLASFGWDRECQIPSEIKSDENARQPLIEAGHFLAQDKLMIEMGLTLRDYELVCEGLRWVPPTKTPK